MTIFSTHSNSTTTTTGSSTSTGTITITVSDEAGGGDLETQNVDVIVAVQESSYSFTGGNPAGSSTFGTNGARWSGLEFEGEQEVQYSYSSTSSPGSLYMVTVIDNKGDGAATQVLFGSIPGVSLAETVLASSGKREFAFAVDREKLKKLLDEA